MTAAFDLLLLGGRVFTPEGLVEADLGVRDGRIAAIGRLAGADAAETIPCAGLTLLPGVIDTQVHFREPGNEHKEDLGTGTAAAALGGVTAICEMPNTKPPTTTAELLADKLARAKGRAWVDHAFFVGATPENIDELARLERCPAASASRCSWAARPARCWLPTMLPRPVCSRRGCAGSPSTPRTRRG